MITVRTETFEGPFDLLFHLIEKHELDIYDIPISLLADQYLAQLDAADAADMDGMSEFVRMAATLLEIKSKLLLPLPKTQAEEPEDPRAELVRRLVEYKRYKDVLDDFRAREQSAALVFYKTADATIPLREMAKQAVSLEDALGGVSAEQLYGLFLEVMNRRELKVDRVRADFGQIARDAFTVAQQTAHLAQLVSLYGQIGFYAAFDAAATKLEKIVTFLALLELIKARRVRVAQDALFGEILIIRVDNGETDGD